MLTDVYIYFNIVFIFTYFKSKKKQDGKGGLSLFGSGSGDTHSSSSCSCGPFCSLACCFTPGKSPQDEKLEAIMSQNELLLNSINDDSDGEFISIYEKY